MDEGAEGLRPHSIAARCALLCSGFVLLYVNAGCKHAVGQRWGAFCTGALRREQVFRPGFARVAF